MSLVVVIRILDLPAYVFLLIWIGFQAYQHAASRYGGETGGVAYLAHIGGFIAGLALIFVFQDSQPAPAREPDVIMVNRIARRILVDDLAAKNAAPLRSFSDGHSGGRCQDRGRHGSGSNFFLDLF